MTIKAYDKLNIEDKEKIVLTYKEKYISGVNTFDELAKSIGISARAFSRVLKEAKINTSRKNKYSVNESYFETIDTELKAYLLGLISADGFVGNNNYIALQSKDKELIEMLAKAIEYTGEIRLIKNASGYSTKTDHFRINFSSPKMASDLRSHGKILGNINDFPDIEDKLIRHFLRGYYDGDGGPSAGISTSYYKGKKYSYLKPAMRIITTKPFGEKCSEYLKNELNINLSKSQSKTPYMIYVGTHSIGTTTKLYQYLYNDANYFLERKKRVIDNVFTQRHMSVMAYENLEYAGNPLELSVPNMVTI